MPPVDPQCQAFLDVIKVAGGPSWEEMGVAQSRLTFDALDAVFGTGPADVQATDLKIDGRIPIRVYRRDAEVETSPVLVFFHGGGWVLGNLNTHDALCRRLCSQAQCVVVSVDYRLAPEHVFPAALDDCYAAVGYVASQGNELRIDPTRLIVAGDSAGGNLAAAVAIKARNESDTKILAQVLIYPVLDRGCDSASYQSLAEGYGLTRDDMKWFWRQYAGDAESGVYLSPSQADSLRGLPPTVVITAQYDVLRDEGEAFAQQLSAAGVNVDHRRYDGAIHGFVHFAGAMDIGMRATKEIAQDIRRLFGESK
jgi:acetyl esterase